MNNRLWEYRRKFNIDAQKFAILTGVSPGELSKIERGYREPSGVFRDSCARILGVPIEVLFPKFDEEYRQAQIPIKDNILKELEQVLRGVDFCCRKLTEMEVNQYLFVCDEILERLFIEQKVPLDDEVGALLIKKIKYALETKEEDLQNKKEEILE